MAPTADEVVAVAVAHGTPVAARWAGLTPSWVRDLRRRAGHSVDRGRPTAAELARAARRPGCPCGYCTGPLDQPDDVATPEQRARIRDLDAQRYTPATIARILTLDPAVVDAVLEPSRRSA